MVGIFVNDAALSMMADEIEELYGDYSSTYIFSFAEDEDNVYALVFHCTKEEGLFEDGYKSYDAVWGKIAYQPKNSAMQEYDIDWNMPEVTGFVYDSEYEIPKWASRYRVMLTMADWRDDMRYIIDNLNLVEYGKDK